ncbi:MAG: hypothetical protein CM15mP22_0400 [Gammaproteobacteria bacterium]|nr:MAG: hypothetical protein CM15mP22_0400 [Gammaproteobacteria bacterium]
MKKKKKTERNSKFGEIKRNEASEKGLILHETIENFTIIKKLILSTRVQFF